MAGWHHWIDGCEFEWTPGVVDGQGGVACWDSWVHKELDMTERLNWTEWYTYMFINEMFISGIVAEFWLSLMYYVPIILGTISESTFHLVRNYSSTIVCGLPLWNCWRKASTSWMWKKKEEETVAFWTNDWNWGTGLPTLASKHNTLILLQLSFFLLVIWKTSLMILIFCIQVFSLST